MAVARDLKMVPGRLRTWTQRSGRRAWHATRYAWVIRAKEIASRVRSRHLFVLDSFGILAAALIALAIWSESAAAGASASAYLWIAGIVVSARAVVNITLGLYGYSWRHASVADMGRIISCVVAGSLLSAVIVLVLVALRPAGVQPMPMLTFWLTEMLFTLVVLATPRFSIRATSDLRVGRRGSRQAEAEPTLLYGAGWAGVIVARSATRKQGSTVLPVGFLDDDLDLKGRRVGGLYVYGDSSALPEAIRKTNATTLLITMPNTPGVAVRAAVEAALERGLKVRTVPPMTDLLDGSLDAGRIRNVRVEDLLRRPLADEHAPSVQAVFENSVVAITGAAGSIGSELARQVLAVNPRRIALIDQAESPLYLLQRDLEEIAGQHAARTTPTSQHARKEAIEITSHLVDVSERPAITRLFEQLRPDVVLHAAAYKHVPVLEDYPRKAIRTNVGGTQAVVDAAEAAQVKRFLLVSTDKAVWPSSVMGASKRVAEMIVAEAAQRLGRPYISVRFGNVLGSSGSVVPIFQNQLEKGQPLTVTDPEMTRYFMTIPEASWLILDAAAIADQGGLFVLDMGKPVKIMDVARDLMRLAGRDPDSVPIEITGLRKGEKLHEQLFYNQETAQPTGVQKVLRADSPPPPPGLRDQIGRMMTIADGEHDEELRAELHAYVRESLQREEGSWMTADADQAEAERLLDLPDLVALPIHTNGQSNGHANGQSNGHANGQSNGHTNGQSPVPRDERAAPDERGALVQ